MRPITSWQHPLSTVAWTFHNAKYDENAWRLGHRIYDIQTRNIKTKPHVRHRSPEKLTHLRKAMIIE